MKRINNSKVLKSMHDFKKVLSNKERLQLIGIKHSIEVLETEIIFISKKRKSKKNKNELVHINDIICTLLRRKNIILRGL